MSNIQISDHVRYIGVDDKTIQLFESQYDVPNGVSYNSYLILDDKIAVMDTVDARATEEWLANLEAALDGRTPDYLVVLHMEPDHSASIHRAAEKYPEMQIVGNAKTFPMIAQFFPLCLEGRTVVVKEGDTLSLGNHTLQFFMAPMVHWPEVMVAYEQSEKLLFSADGFGKFGTLDTDEPCWRNPAGITSTSWANTAPRSRPFSKRHPALTSPKSALFMAPFWTKTWATTWRNTIPGAAMSQRTRASSSPAPPSTATP